MCTHRAARAGRLGLPFLMILVAAGAHADTGSDWLAKVPPPPKDLPQAKALCGENVAYADNPWSKFEEQRQAAADKLQQDMQAKLSSPDAQAAMAEQAMAQMSDPGAMMAVQKYAQYQADLGTSAPAVTGARFFAAPYQRAQDAVAAILKDQAAKLKKCPTRDSEAGRYYLPACEEPIDAAAEKRKAAAVDQYLAEVDKAWPKFMQGTRDYFKKLATVPDGVDPGNYQVKVQQDNIPGVELGAVNDVAQAASDACGNANGLKAQFPNLDMD